MPDEFFLPPGYEDLADDCRRFLADHPDYGRNVFIMTRFVPGNRLLARLDETLRQSLCRHGLKGLRADDRVYPNGRELWRNVCVYMLCCKYGVAVLEDRIADFMAEVAAYWTADPLEAELAPQPGPPAWAVPTGAEILPGAACS